MQSIGEIIYLDNNATTPIDKRVLEAMMPYLTNEYANANSTHIFGLKASEAVKESRKQVAELLGAQPHEIVFTSGATEAINLAIKGISENFNNEGKHIITVCTEHSAVLDTCKYIESKGFDVTYLPVKEDGLIDLEVLRDSLKDETILVSIMLANNETGVIQPIKEISSIVHEKGVLLFTDATQAAGKIPIDVNELDVDLLCLSGHKLYAPKGIGALYNRQTPRRVKLQPLIHGGGHERGLRSGTLNVPGIIALGAACSFARKEMDENSKHIASLRDYLESELLKIEGTFFNGSKENRLFNTSNICFKGVDSDALIIGLSDPDHETPVIALSNGSACTSASIDPSHVLISMGLSQDLALNCIRFSLSKFNSESEIKIVIQAINKVVSRLRTLINYYPY
jgi:cysteine desulfurase